MGEGVDQLNSTLAEIAQALSSHTEVRSLKEENLVFRAEISKLSQKGQNIQPILQTPKFRFPDPKAPRVGSESSAASSGISPAAQPVQISVATP